MKIDRLIGILSILLQEERVTAKELAERFEVSRRTINRDIEDICKAGIPLVTWQGFGGGIGIMDGYKLDRTILSSKDMRMIMAGLRGLDSVSGSNCYGQLMEKLRVGSSSFVEGNDSLLIDLSTWHKTSLMPKIQLLQDAIDLGKMIHFQYYGPHGESARDIEPYYLIFKWSDWYVYGYCLAKKDFRLFKLKRMVDLALGQCFEKRQEVPLPDLANESVFPPRNHVKAIFDADLKWYLVEEYGPDAFIELEDGKLLLEHEYSDVQSLISWMLLGRDKVTVLEPASVRDELFRIASEMVEKYRKEG